MKTLWHLRFEKMRKNEEEAAWTYLKILEDCLQEFNPDHEVIDLLKQLIREERAHEKMAEELLKICHRSHPEVGLD